jgi:hypothetical protein
VYDNGLPATNNFRTKSSSTVDAKFAANQELLIIVKLPEKNVLFYMKFFLYICHKVIDRACDFAQYNGVHVISCTCSIVVTLYFIISVQRYFTITEEETSEVLCLIYPIDP